MVARTPPKQKKVDARLNPILLREPVKKVDECMARLQELQYTFVGGTKVVSGESLSPRSTRDYLRTSLRCKQESLRCRPLNQAEMANGSTSIVDFESSRENQLQIICSDSSKKQFKFDHVFRPGSDQEAVFAQTSPIVTSMLDGYNGCIFAYGHWNWKDLYNGRNSRK
ncbi:hypothetical protein PVL29_024869 [Vitis rotundifolia]|uniref:Kinesin motor domain-containing protein n=1 Tax=Vitis rotundifolia TaxID=103349 RepID=A0AA38YSX4_VITRO|nr:hypothetical protein PVL29_024869 [Vitis rotundifolia]